MIIQEPIQQLDLIKDSFSPSEARYIAHVIIDNQVNVYKLQKLQDWVGDQSSESSMQEYKISKLAEKKQEITEMIAEAKELGLDITVNVTFELN